MQIKVLIIAIIKKDNSVLMRKKPDGSPPYRQTWYLFGAQATPDTSPDEALKKHVKNQAGIDIRIDKKFSWDTEVKQDLDGVEKFFVYLDVLCEYTAGEPTLTPGIEKLEWVEIDRLKDYDIVPPSVEVFKKLGYIK
jgi:8-oxo-dGTP pyrophosphatase MutT (NUDIX family)